MLLEVVELVDDRHRHEQSDPCARDEVEGLAELDLVELRPVDVGAAVEGDERVARPPGHDLVVERVVRCGERVMQVLKFGAEQCVDAGVLLVARGEDTGFSDEDLEAVRPQQTVDVRGVIWLRSAFPVVVTKET
ncbi:hypothetical protein ACIRG5_45360 [Lentzea sp. NPDC102401]|uniref:hypothetical protein n=1 Tax=Lentzea sp. NPDC102401 TaxID=3364128 RepID=UPI0038070203